MAAPWMKVLIFDRLIGLLVVMPVKEPPPALMIETVPLLS